MKLTCVSLKNCWPSATSASNRARECGRSAYLKFKGRSRPTDCLPPRPSKLERGSVGGQDQTLRTAHELMQPVVLIGFHQPLKRAVPSLWLMGGEQDRPAQFPNALLGDL